jgi:hypothetical protein
MATEVAMGAAFGIPSGEVSWISRGMTAISAKADTSISKTFILKILL